MSEPLDSRLKYLVDNWLFLNNDIRTMFMDNKIYFEELARYCDRDDLLSMTLMKNSAPIPLTKTQVRTIYDIIGYYNFMYWNGDRAYAEVPIQWNTKHFKKWKLKEQPFSYNKWRRTRLASTFASHSTSFAGTTPTTALMVISTKSVLTEEAISDCPIKNIDLTDNNISEEKESQVEQSNEKEEHHEANNDEIDNASFQYDILAVCTTTTTNTNSSTGYYIKQKSHFNDNSTKNCIKQRSHFE